MIETLLALAVALLLVVGALFTLTAAIGINRLPDVYTRMHAASKAGAVGSGLLLLAAGLHAGEAPLLLRALAGMAFLVLTAPVSAHLLASAARRAGYPLAAGSVRDDSKRNTL